MAQLSLDLSQFKSSGVYTIEIDNSERIVVTTQSLRLLAGFSSTGPFNTPVFIRSTKDRIKFYGTLDTKLERKGSFFHRSIDTALLQSPTFAINLLNVNQTPGVGNTDTVNYTALSLDTSSNNTLYDVSLGSGTTSVKILSSLYSNFFNKERFWKSDPDYLQGVVQNGFGVSSEDSAPLFQIVNIGTKTLSFIIRKAVGLQGYDVYATDWYGSDTAIPYEWIRPYDKIKDYFIQIIAFEGNWTNYNQLSTDPVYSQYFNSKGLIPSKTTDFLNLPQISLAGSWIGTFIPGFRDNTGADQFIENVVNGSTVFTGVMVNVNQTALDNLIYDSAQQQWELGDGSATSAAPYLVDLVGHNMAIYRDPSTSLASRYNHTFMSYDISIADASFHSAIAVTLLDTTGKSFTIDASSDQSSLTIGTLVTKNYSGDIAPGVTSVIAKYMDASSNYIVETAEPVYIVGGGVAGNIIAQKTIDDSNVTDHYKIIKLAGLSITNNHLPGYTTTGQTNAESGITKIYSMLADPGIQRGLLNPDMINYRYIVDTMAYGLGSNMGGKVYLSRLAKARGKCTAILSAPSIKQFATAQNPYFCDTFVPGVAAKPVFSTEWVAQGGNPDMPRSFRFTLPDEDNGAKYTGVFGPFLRYTENGITFDVPPAADVSNTYVRKFLGGNPYAICANNNGIISNPTLAGVEYNIDKTDRDYLEPFGYNSIIERPTTGQVLIYANATTFQNVKSDYNYLHVRELLNTIELQVEEVLKNYVFEFNNAVTRLNIVNSVSPILESIKDAGALYKYEITMDDSNNPGEIVDEGFAILDIGVWITKGMQKIINRITVNKLGTVSSGGFAA